MDKEVSSCTPETPENHWEAPWPGFGHAYDAFWEFHRKTEERLRRRACKRHPEMSYEETEAIVAVELLEMFVNHKDKFLAHLPAAANRERGSPLAGSGDQHFSASMVQWKI